MIKHLLHSKEKELKKTWPENCPWSKPKYYGIEYDEDLDFDGRDEGIRVSWDKNLRILCPTFCFY